jgi:hypothetical protein
MISACLGHYSNPTKYGFGEMMKQKKNRGFIVNTIQGLPEKWHWCNFDIGTRRGCEAN